jgi:beta-galactosidase/beta-glucuronidase
VANTGFVRADEVSDVTNAPDPVDYPRPQLRRANWVDLCGQWQFAYDDDGRGLDEDWFDRADVFDRAIIVPFPPESTASGIGETGFHPVVWYRRTFSAAAAEDQRVLLHFGAVDYRAQVWVNGQLVATHEGGNTPFSADITSAMRRSNDGEHVLVVRAEDDPHDLTQPRGKQDWQLEPHRIWYHRTTGIWQPVWLEQVADVHITELRWSFDLTRSALDMSVRLNRKPADSFRLRIRLSLHDQLLADDTYFVEGDRLIRAIAIDSGQAMMRPEVTLWSPECPNLIDAELTLLDGDTVVDRVESYTGLRSCGAANGRFLLNGRPYYTRMVLEQGYWPESHLAAPSGDTLRREVELIRALGFNGVRIHQKVEDPRFLYWCDRIGLLVWGEMANAYDYSPDGVARFTREWLEVIRRDVSHPCIVTWVPVNESWGVLNLEGDPAQREYVKALAHLTRALDPTRPVISNDGWEHLASDILTIHDYTHDAERIRERYGSRDALARTIREVQPAHRRISMTGANLADEPVMLTEFGGINFATDPDRPHWGYSSAHDAGSFLAAYGELVSAVLDSTDLAGYCYTQLTDTMQETNGLLTENREPKVDIAAIHAINTQPSRSMPAEAVRAAQKASESATTSKTQA